MRHSLFVCSIVLLPTSLRVGLVPIAAAQDVFHVDDDHADDPAPGDPLRGNPFEDGSAESPFDAIQEALDASIDGDLILVSPGVYRGLGNKNLDFGGREVTVLGVAGPSETVIDCEGDGRGFFFQLDETPASIVEGFTIRDGFSVGESVGGGIRIVNSSPTIRRCIITECSVFQIESSGGGLHCLGGDPEISECVFSENFASGVNPRGGGIFLDGCNAKITDTLITENQGGFAGGGLVCEGGSNPVLHRCTISRNFAQFGGGILCQSKSNPTLRSCRIVDNSAASTAGILCTEGSSPGIHDSLIARNMTQSPFQPPFQRGGIDCFSGSSPKIFNSTIVDNAHTGVGCFSLSSRVTIRNCLLRGNGDDLANCTATFSFVGDGDAGAGNITGDPFFLGTANYRLQSASPCIDSGDPGFTPIPRQTDLDGHARVLCGRVDIGAFEYGIGDMNCDRAVDLDDYAGWHDCATGPSTQREDASCKSLDFNGDARVDLKDFAGFANVFGE